MTTERAPSKKKIKKFEGIKKPLMVGGFIAAFAVAGIVGGVIILNHQQERSTLYIAIWDFPPPGYIIIEPLSALGGSQLINNQIAETLLDTNYTDSNSQIMPNLAKAWNWSYNHSELTCYLREDVHFHDGTSFNATAVKWNFDRISRFYNPSNPQATLYSHLFFLPDYRWIVNETQVVDEYTIKFVLNEPFVPFEQVLTHSVTSILSPKSTPSNRILNIQTDELVGTGPFMLSTYNPGVNLTLDLNPNYWGRKQPKVDKLVFSIYNSEVDIYNALLAKEIHYVTSGTILGSNVTIETLRNVPEIKIERNPSLDYQFVAIDNSAINLTMRKAISYAINYSLILEESNKSVEVPFIRFRSCVPDGILYYNITGIDVPYYNISKARQFLIDDRWPGTENLTADEDTSTGNDWEQLVTDGTPLATYTLEKWPWGGLLNITIGQILDSLNQIGVKGIFQPWGSGTDMFSLGWIYDYNDPYMGLFMDFHSKWNWGNLNDSLIDQWIEDGYKETNPVLRKQIYYNIQERLIEEIYPYLWISHRVRYDIYLSNLGGFQFRWPDKILFKTCYLIT